MGAIRDIESDGQPTPSADGDGADDDGVTFGAIQVGQLGATATVNVQNAPVGAKLDAWIDFDRDGTWGGHLEQIANSVAVVAGDNTLTFDVPSWAADGQTFAPIPAEHGRQPGRARRGGRRRGGGLRGDACSCGDGERRV